MALAAILIGVAVAQGAVGANAQQPGNTTVYVAGGSSPEEQLTSQVLARLDETTSLSEFRLTLEFDGNVVRPERVELASGWVEIPAAGDDGAGRLSVGATREVSCGPGAMCGLFTVTWEAVSPGESPVQIAGVELLNAGSPIDGVEAVGGRVNVTPSAVASDAPPSDADAGDTGSGSTGGGVQASSPPRYELTAVALTVVAVALTVVLGALGVVTLARRVAPANARPRSLLDRGPISDDFAEQVTAYLEDVEQSAAGEASGEAELQERLNRPQS